MNGVKAPFTYTPSRCSAQHFAAPNLQIILNNSNRMVRVSLFHRAF